MADPSLGLVLLAVCLTVAVIGRHHLYTWLHQLTLRWSMNSTSKLPPTSRAPARLVGLPTPPAQRRMASTVPQAGRASADPPAFAATMRYLAQVDPDGAYLIPIGWYETEAGPAPIWVSLETEVYHLGVTGQSGAGKEGIMRMAALSLAQRYGPDAVRFGIIDGSRGVNWGCWEDRAHCWAFVAYQDGKEGKEALRTFTARLEQELATRAELLRDRQVDSWEELPHRDRPPLLLILVTEVDILALEFGATFDRWMTQRLSEARKFGVRFILQTQTFSGMEGRYRKQLSLFVAGYQAVYHDDRPNTGLGTGDLELLGAVPPSKIPPVGEWPGVFTVVHGREVETVRASHLPGSAMRALVADLPTACLPAPTRRAEDQASALLRKVFDDIPAPTPPPEDLEPPLDLATFVQQDLDERSRPITWTRQHVQLAILAGLALAKGQRWEAYKSVDLIRQLYPEAAAKGQRGSYAVKVRHYQAHLDPVLDAVQEALVRPPTADPAAKPPESTSESVA